MADNEQYSDEYQFADLDGIPPDLGEGAETMEGETNIPNTLEDGPKSGYDMNVIKRNSIIGFGVVLFILVAYKLISMVSTEKQKLPVAMAPIAPPRASEPTPSPQPVITVSPAPALSTSDVSQINQKLSTLEVNQQSARADMTSVSDQVGTLSTNVNTLTSKMAELNQVISTLTTKLDEQSQEIEKLVVQREKKIVHHVSRPSQINQKRYFIQAVIPGRAWLIATNGSTLTVREGTVIPGYGMVKLIDPTQGRVLTSSGQVIKFSQEDS